MCGLKQDINPGLAIAMGHSKGEVLPKRISATVLFPVASLELRG
jgi:hypothetical protein